MEKNCKNCGAITCIKNFPRCTEAGFQFWRPVMPRLEAVCVNCGKMYADHYGDYCPAEGGGAISPTKQKFEEVKK